jgi:hypothetical protein
VELTKCDRRASRRPPRAAWIVAPVPTVNQPAGAAWIVAPVPTVNQPAGAAWMAAPAPTVNQPRRRRMDRRSHTHRESAPEGRHSLAQGGRVCVATAKSRYPHPFSTYRFVGATRLARFSKKYKLWKSRLRHRLGSPGYAPPAFISSNVFPKPRRGDTSCNAIAPEPPKALAESIQGIGKTTRLKDVQCLS